MCVSTAVSAWAKTGDVAQAEQWRTMVPELGAEPDAVSSNAAIDACARAGGADRAEPRLKRMRRPSRGRT